MLLQTFISTEENDQFANISFRFFLGSQCLQEGQERSFAQVRAARAAYYIQKFRFKIETNLAAKSFRVGGSSLLAGFNE